LCQQLLSAVELDCLNFANNPSNPFRCCSSLNQNDDSCSAVVKGCEDGTQFFLRVSVQNSEVYRQFPRVLAEDTAGNKIRTGAITDRDYDAPISYPFFKYLDEAFKFNEYLAYGADSISDAPGAQQLDKGAARGVVEGSCVGNSNGTHGCDKIGFSFLPGNGYDRAPFATEDEARKYYSRAFANSILKKAGDGANNSGLLTLFAIPNSGRKSYLDIILDPENSETMDALNIRSRQCADPNFECPYIDSLSNEIVFVDYDPVTQVRPDLKNEFCWTSISSFQG
ncbi:MAG: hypothetical protein V1835_02950, partial [Candidatus Micrarchaeota archaeon]